MAMGVAVGVFYALSPFFGIKTVIAMATSWALGGHVIAAGLVVTLLDVFLPLLPFFLAAATICGHMLLNIDTAMTWSMFLSPWENRGVFFHELEPLKNYLMAPWQNQVLLLQELWPITLGFIVLSLPLILLSYVLTFRYWTRRIKRIRQEERKEKQEHEAPTHKHHHVKH